MSTQRHAMLEALLECMCAQRPYSNLVLRTTHNMLLNGMYA